MRINVGSVWKKVAALTVKVAGVWKPVTTGWVKVAGVWKKMYPLNPAIFLNGVSSGAGNCFHYETISRLQFPVVAGDQLVYDMYLGANTVSGGLDAAYEDGTGTKYLRGVALVDQKGWGIHPGQSVTDAQGKWFTRTFNLNLLVGATVTLWAIVHEDDAGGWHEIYIRNARILRADGSLKMEIFINTLNVPEMATFQGTSNGYSQISKSIQPGP